MLNMGTNLPSKKSKDISVILRLMDFQHRLHCGLHIVRDGTESKQQNFRVKSKYANHTPYFPQIGFCVSTT